MQGSIDGVGVIAEDKGPVEPDAVVVQAIYYLFIVSHDDVELLIHESQGIVAERFEADQHSGAATLRHDFKQLFISRHIQGTLTQPVDFERNKFTAELARVLEVSDEIVIHQEDIAVFE